MIFDPSHHTIAKGRGNNIYTTYIEFTAPGTPQSGEWFKILPELKTGVYEVREDRVITPWNAWCRRLCKDIAESDYTHLFKVHNETGRIDGAALVGPAENLHYGWHLCVYHIFNFRGSPRLLWEAIVSLADLHGLDYVSRSKHIRPFTFEKQFIPVSGTQKET